MSTPEVQSWRSVQRAKGAIARCHDQDHDRYGDWGGRGIRVCDEWVNDPHAFAAYLETLPGAFDGDLILDRIDNDGHYEPGNLRFATYAVSNRNKRPHQRTMWEPLYEPGTVIGSRTLVEFCRENRTWRCVCKCGEEHTVEERAFGRARGSKMCAKCHNLEQRQYVMPEPGFEYGQLTVRCFDAENGRWLCDCSCGNIHLVTRQNLTKGRTTKCLHCAYKKEKAQ